MSTPKKPQDKCAKSDESLYRAVESPLLHAPLLHRPLFHTIVRRFLRDDDIVDVALAQSRRRDANEPALFLELFQRARAHITHSAAQPAHKLVGQPAQRSFIRDASFHPL